MANKVEAVQYKTLREAIEVLGETDALNYINQHEKARARRKEYNIDKQARLAIAKNDPRVKQYIDEALKKQIQSKMKQSA